MLGEAIGAGRNMGPHRKTTTRILRRTEYGETPLFGLRDEIGAPISVAFHS